MSLANVFRPQTFGSSIGQAAKINGDILRNQVRTGKVGHAYLFSGLRGSGKTTTARIMAKAVNCLSPVDGEPCNNCKACRAIDEGSLVDVKEVDAARNNGVDFAKSLEEDASFMPIEGKKKVFILDECHCMTADAFSSMLKLIEQPPEWAIFILATTDPQKVPVTIRSRCQEYRFKAVSVSELSAHLKGIAEEYGATLTDAAAECIARHSEGSVRDAVRNLEVCLGEEVDITESRVADILGIESWEQIFLLLEAILANNRNRIAAMVERYFSEGRKIFDIITDMMKAVSDHLQAKAGSSIEGTEEYVNKIMGIDIPDEKCFMLFDSLGDVLDRIRYSSDKTTLAVLFMKVAMKLRDGDGTEKRIAALEREVEALRKMVSKKIEPSEPIVNTEPEPEAFAAEGFVYAGDMEIPFPKSPLFEEPEVHEAACPDSEARMAEETVARTEETQPVTDKGDMGNFGSLDDIFSALGI